MRSQKYSGRPHLFYLHIKTRMFSLVRSKMDAHKLFLRKSKTRSLRTGIKKSCDTQQARETSVEEYKNSYFDSYTQKQLFLWLLIRKKIFCSIISGWYMELSVLNLKNKYFHGLFQSTYSEQHILQKINYKMQSPGPENVL